MNYPVKAFKGVDMTNYGGPGNANRNVIGIMQLTAMFPDESLATVWFEALVWPDGRHCPR